MNLKNIKNMKFDSKMFGNIGNIIKQNGSTISMIGSFLCLGGALYSAFKASHDVADIQDKYDSDVAKMRSEGQETPEKARELKGTRNIRYILAYKWAILFGVGAGVLTFTTHYLDGLAIGGLTTALALEKDKVKKMIENGKEVFGDVPWKEVEEKSLEDLISEKFFGKDDQKSKILLDTNGDLLLVDAEEVEIIQTNSDDLDEILKAAETYTKTRGLSIYEFYTKFIGVPLDGEGTRVSSNVKFWGPDNPFKAHVGKIDMFGGTLPCLVYDIPPTTAWKAGVPGAKNPNK